MAKGKRNIEPWEAALIKAMLSDGGYTRDQIVSYFSRPERTVNQFRINEIKDEKIYADVPAAKPAQIRAFLKTFGYPREARRQFFEESPLHPANLLSLFRIKDGSSNVLHIDETDQIECKENINLGNKGEYARVIASFANASGGFLLFGVRDKDKRVTGINKGKLTNYEPAKLNQFLSEHFAPVPIWEKSEIEISKKTVGVIYARSAVEKPVVCTRNDGSVLREADIYYRYPGETRRIKHAELSRIIRKIRKDTEQEWTSVLNRVADAGVENVAILNTLTGEVAGRAGKFLIDEDLLPKISFVSEGRFAESADKPALRLIGDVEPVTVGGVHSSGETVRKVHLADSDLIQDFLDQREVEEPTMYIRHLAYSAKLWLPVFCYIRQAGISDNEAAHLVQDEISASSAHINRLAKRIEQRIFPSGAPKISSVENEREKICNKTMAVPADLEHAHGLAKAVRTLKPGEINPDFLLPLLKKCFEKFQDSRTISAFRYALAHVDVVLHEQINAHEA